MTRVIDFFPAPVLAPPDADGPAGFTTQWHGHGAGHQANNDAGDTAADRHNFDAATAGKSGVNPTQGSAQDDFSAETGLPLIPVPASHAMHDMEDDLDDEMDMLF